MMNNSYIALGVSLCAGGLVSFSSADEPLVALEASRGRVVEAAHIYYNIATGERVVTTLHDGPASGQANGTGGAIWSSRVSNQCADAGYTSEYFYALSTSCTHSSVCFGSQEILDIGDVATDSVVDMVHINWVSEHVDVDLNSDGIGDGVVGLAAEWTWWDADNGRAVDISTRQALVSFRFVDLPGNILGQGNFSRYSVDVDLEGSFSSSLTFEIGDSDGDAQGAAFHHPNIANEDNNNDGIPDGDLDGDGLFDWAWSVEFSQPGTIDTDGDGVPDGDFGDAANIGVSFGAPEGVAVDNGDGEWVWEIDTSIIDAGTGVEDAFAIYFNGIHAGFFWFGGLNCDPDQPNGYTPAAMFEHQLFGPSGGVCVADLNSDGVLNFFDVSLFIVDYLGGGDYNGDGGTNFFDVSEFLADFGNGCP
jgi:hypothetical protein